MKSPERRNWQRRVKVGKETFGNSVTSHVFVFNTAVDTQLIWYWYL